LVRINGDAVGGDIKVKPTMRLSDFVEINPKVSLLKGYEYTFVGMEIVKPGYRFVSSHNKRFYQGGGAKFRSGDTLFARITPCLENGKIAQFSGANGEIGFGSTEFFILRHKDGISDPGYLFYLAKSTLTSGYKTDVNKETRLSS